VAAGETGEGPVERAELMVAELEKEARRLISLGVARAVELAEDLWAEAQSVRSEDKPS
jgi:hypothetical protein